jgi:uncharacterized protein
VSTTIQPSAPARCDGRPGVGPLLAIGVAAGIVGGLAGGGGGIVTVPVLDHITTLTRSENHGTSTFVNVFVAVAGVSFYIWRGGDIDAGAGLGMIVGGIIGAPLGARFAKKTSDALLRGIFITVLVVATIDLLAHAAGGGESRRIAGLLPLSLLHDSLSVAFAAGVIGVVVGAWSAAMGLGEAFSRFLPWFFCSGESNMSRKERLWSSCCPTRSPGLWRMCVSVRRHPGLVS